MDSLAKCLTCFRRNEHKVEHAKSVRNNFLNCCEKTNIFLNVLLLFFGFIMCVTGISFITNDLWGEAQFSLRQVKKAVMAIVISYMFLIPIFACTGILIARKRNTHCIVQVIWGVFIFFFVAIPLMAEGSVYLAIDNISNETIESICAMNETEVTEKYDRVTRALYMSAKRYDLWTEELLDQYMCNERVCPCLAYDTDKGNTQTIFQGYPQRLSQHNRTFDQTKAYSSDDLIYMYFTPDKKLGFSSMIECINFYEKLEEDQVVENATDIFELDIEKFIKQSPKKFSTDDEGTTIPKKNIQKVMETHVQEIEFYLEIEDYYNCSGMCKPSLFYFTKNLGQGPPTQTCLLQTKEFLSGASRSFAVTSVLAGVTSLFLFFLHFCLYCRPQELSNQNNEYAVNEHQQDSIDPNAIVIELPNN